MDAANRYRMVGIAKWCNGSTTDSGSVCLGSSPSLATERIPYGVRFLYIFVKIILQNLHIYIIFCTFAA